MSSHLAQELVSVIRINSRVLEAGYEKHLWVGTFGPWPRARRISKEHIDILPVVLLQASEIAVQEDRDVGSRFGSRRYFLSL